MADNTSDSGRRGGGFPGYGFLDGYFNLYVDELKGVARSWNRTWDKATSDQGNYTFGNWVRDWGRIWSRAYGVAERMGRYPVSYDEEDRPVWVPILADNAAQSAQSLPVKLHASVDDERALTATNLERLGAASGTSIQGPDVKVALQDQRDSIIVSIPLAGKNYDKGTYVGFVKNPSGTGAPLAIIFLSYGT